MHHPRTLVALALTGLLLATGCSDDPAEAEPEPILPSSSTAAPSNDPSESERPDDGAPEMPAAAEERTFPGAEAFVRHWVEAFNFATSTGETDELGKLDIASCAGCVNSINTIDEVYEGGGRIESRGWEVRRVGANPGEGLEAPILAARIVRSPQDFYRKNPDSTERFAGGPAAYLFSLAWRGEEWKMTGIQVLDPQ